MAQDKNTSEEDLARLQPSADKWDTGPLQSRLYDVIDRNRDGKMTAAEIREALKIPAHAQALSRIVLCCESEWRYQKEKWDALDDIFGHTTSAPILNWVAEKERIKMLSWWDEVAGALKSTGRWPVYFLHPIGLSTQFDQKRCACDRDITVKEFESILTKEQMEKGIFSRSRHSSIRGTDVQVFLILLNEAMRKHGITDCIDKAFF